MTVVRDIEKNSIGSLDYREEYIYIILKRFTIFLKTFPSILSSVK